MGAPMAKNLAKAGHSVLGFDTANVSVDGVELVQTAAEVAKTVAMGAAAYAVLFALFYVAPYCGVSRALSTASQSHNAQVLASLEGHYGTTAAKTIVSAAQKAMEARRAARAAAIKDSIGAAARSMICGYTLVVGGVVAVSVGGSFASALGTTACIAVDQLNGFLKKKLLGGPQPDEEASRNAWLLETLRHQDAVNLELTVSTMNNFIKFARVQIEGCWDLIHVLGQTRKAGILDSGIAEARYVKLIPGLIERFHLRRCRQITLHL